MAHRPDKNLTAEEERELDAFLNGHSDSRTQASSLSGCSSIAGEGLTRDGMWLYGARAKQQRTAKRPV